MTRSGWHHSPFWLRSAVALASAVALLAGPTAIGAQAGMVQAGSTDPPAGAPTDGDWPAFHEGTDRIGVNSVEHTLGRTNVGSLTLQWSYMTGASVWSSPAVAGGVVYFGSDDSYVYALDAVTGSRIWSFKTGGMVRSSPTVANGVVYVGSDDDNVYALSTSTGSQIWSFTAGGNIELSSPLVANGLVYVGALDGYLYAIDQATGTLRWSAYVWAMRGSAAMMWNTLYVGSDQALLFAIDATTGTIKWTSATGGRIRGSPAVRQGVVYVGADDYRVYAFNTSNGSLKWATAPLPNLGIVRSTPALANGKVYVDTGETSPMGSNLYVLDQTTGATTCSHSMADYATSSVAVANGVAYVGSFSHQLYAFDATTCDQLWNSGFTIMAGGVPSSPAVSNGTILVGSLDGGMYAFDVEPGPPIGDAVSITDDLFTPSELIGHDIGTSVLWSNAGSDSHTVTDSTGMGLYASGALSPGQTYVQLFFSAGIYPYVDSLHPTATGTVKAPMIVDPTTGTEQTLFTVTWATQPPPPGFVYDIQITRPGDPTWLNFKTSTLATSVVYLPLKGPGVYSWRAHIRNSSNGSSANYSAAVSFVVT